MADSPSPVEYRPISVASVIVKYFHILARIIELNNRIENVPEQSGFIRESDGCWE